MELYSRYFDRSMARKPYGDEREYWADLLAMLDMRLAVLISWRTREEGSEGLVSHQAAGELPLSEAFTFDLLGKGRLIPAKAGERAGMEAGSEIARAASHVMERLSQTSGGGQGFTLRKLFRLFHLSRFEQFVFVTAMALRLDARYGTLYEACQGIGRTCPTLSLAFALFELTDTIDETEKARLSQGRGELFRYLMDREKRDGAASGQMYAISERFWSFLMGENEIPEALAQVISLPSEQEKKQEILIRQESVDCVKRFVETYGNAKPGDCRVLHLYGDAGNGRHFAVQKGAALAGKGVLFVEITPLYGDRKSLEELIQRLRLEQLLADAVLCFVETGITEEEPDGEERKEREFPADLDYLLKRLPKEFGSFIWMSLERADYLTRYSLHFLALESPMLFIRERIILWQAFGKEFPLEEGIDLNLFANQYILTAKGIRETLIRADMMRSGQEKEKISPELLREAVRQQSVNQLGRSATLINAVFTWDDLVVDEEQKRQMQMICDQVRYRNVVGEKWGFHKKTPYGRGICALLYGSPGTGKTMAVQVMANELGLDLYRIDLSQMVSKYIGETEKNISALFRRARNLNAILFFDEADSMFAKRSEVKDSNDRNANAETAHLLQKLEDYSGITFLATNYVNNIDDAFKRRIKFMIHFVFPEEEVRLRLWNRILPPQAELDEELDLEFFARNFELAGSNIKEVLTNAAYMAAAGHRGISNRDIVEAIRLNFGKYGKVLTADDFGYLGRSI